MKCHKYGKDGEGVGPDLTTLSKRFKRADILESIVFPSKVISDQYRSTPIMTNKGVQLDGLAATQGDTVTVLQSDGSKVTLRKDEIEQQFASLVSVMPETSAGHADEAGDRGPVRVSGVGATGRQMTISFRRGGGAKRLDRALAPPRGETKDLFLDLR